MPPIHVLRYAAPANVGVLDKPKFNRVKFDRVRHIDFRYYRVYRYETEADADGNVDGTSFDRIAEPRFDDADEQTGSKWYRVCWIDTWGNESFKSDPVTAVARGVQTADVEAAAITPSKLLRGGSTNLLKDFELSELENFTLTEKIGAGTEGLFAGVVVVISNDPASGMGNSLNLFDLTASANNSTVYVETDGLTPVQELQEYQVEYRVEEVANLSQAFLDVRWYELDGAGETSLLLEELGVAAVLSTPTPAVHRLRATVEAPAGAVYASVRARMVGNSGAIMNVRYGSPLIRPLPAGADLTHASLTATSTVSFGNTLTWLISSPFVTLDDVFREPRYAKVIFRAKNIGAAGTFTFTFERYKPSVASWVVIDTVSNADIAANRVQYFHFLDDGNVSDFSDWYVSDGPSDQTAYRIRVDPDQAGNSLSHLQIQVEWSM